MLDGLGGQVAYLARAYKCFFPSLALRTANGLRSERGCARNGAIKNKITHLRSVMQISRFFAMALCALTLQACDTTASLDDLRSAPVSTDAFDAALAKNYRTYAEEKLALYDWWTSKFFADKGLLAAYGNRVTPEDPAYWNISEGEQKALRAARDQLMLEEEKSARKENPILLAEAYIGYDCWVESTDKAWNREAIETCQDRFFSALTALQHARQSRENAAETIAQTDVTPPPSPPAPPPVESTSSILYFPFDDDQLGEKGDAALKQLIDYITQSGDAQVVINGHADRAGEEPYNLMLSERRARHIRESLIEAGIPPKRISYFAFGDTDPAVETAAGIAEPLNRRVEIFIE
jgi:outer membrane protein OmpA-like peptidoglycan-associated protein